jgi:multidrug efflux pump subunit AcrA (membrane-fusion protein)
LLIELQVQAIYQKNFDRQQQLVAQKVAPTSRLEDATRVLQQQELSLLNRKNTIANYPNRIAQLKSQVTQSKILLQFAELDLARTHIEAPFDGRILSVDTASGNRVRNGDRVVKLYNTKSLEVRSQIPARYLPMMQTNDATKRLEASIVHNGQTYPLVLDRLSAEASDSQGGIDAFFSLDGGQEIEVGRNLQVIVKLPTQANVAALPALAIYGQNRIYRIVDQRLEALSITRVGDWTSPTGQQLTLVRSAELRSGDQVLITQLPNAVTGLLVETR